MKKFAWKISYLVFAFTLFWDHASALSDVGVGDQAIIFETIDENLNKVNMADLIKSKPLVLCVGSAS